MFGECVFGEPVRTCIWMVGLTGSEPNRVPLCLLLKCVIGGPSAENTLLMAEYESDEGILKIDA